MDVDTEVLLSGHYDALDIDPNGHHDEFEHGETDGIGELDIDYKNGDSRNGENDFKYDNGIESSGEILIGSSDGILSTGEIFQLVSNVQEVVEILNELELGFHPNFGGIFGKFIECVYMQYPAMATATDHRIIHTMADIVHEIIIFQNGNDDTAVHHVIDGLKEIHDQMCVLNGSKPPSLLVRLVCFQHHVANVISLKYLRRWGVAYNRATVYEGMEIPCQRRFFRCWRARQNGISRLTHQAQMYAQKRVQAQFFNHWISSVLLTLQRESTADKAFLSKFLKVWKSQNDYFQQSYVELRHKSLQRRFFLLLSVKHQEIQENNSLACQVQHKTQSHLLQTFFHKWVQNLMVLKESPEYKHQKVLEQRLEFALKQRYFARFKNRHVAVQKLRQFEIHSKQKLLHVFFTRMVHMARMSQLGKTCSFQSQMLLKASVLKAWKHKLNTDKTVRLLQRKHLLYTCFRKWKLCARVHGLERLHEQRNKAHFLHMWRLKQRFNNCSIFRNQKAKILDQWVQKARNFQVWQEHAAQVHHQALQRRVLVKARFKTEVLRDELEIVADLNFQRIHFNKFKAVFSKVQHLQNLQPKTYFLDSFLKKLVLSKWRTAYLESYEITTNMLLSDFQANFQRLSILKTFVRVWRHKSRKIQQKKRALNQNLAFFNNTNILKTEVFLVWMEKAAHYAQLRDRSNTFYNLVLRKRFASFWYQKYTTKALYLQSLADDMINNKDYMLTRNFLQKWSFKHTKNVRRNQQSCELFQEKWHRAHLRTFWDLWRYKYTQETTENGKEMEDMEDMQEIDGMNDTFQSFSISPLHRKNPSSRQNNSLLSYSYLQTPIKNKQPPFTPSHRGPSPTRLSETNQRMRSSKMDALVSRYKHASHASHASLSSVQRPRLSPPKDRQRTKPSPRPPPAPNFLQQSIDVNSVEVNSVDETSLFPNATSSPQSVDIENAKVLHRIKPIHVPFEQEIKVSSPRRLRERFLARSPGADPQPSPTKKSVPSSIFD